MSRLAVLALLATLAVSACTDGSTVTTTIGSAPPISPATVPSTTSSSSTTPTSPAPDTTVPATTAAPTTTTTLAPLRAIDYRVVAELDFPIIVTANRGDDTALVAQRAGLVRILSDGELGEVVLDISDQTTTGGERGLLGLARHPSDPSRLFLHYTDPRGDTVVSEFTYQGGSVDAASEQVLLTVDQPAVNHNGGMIQFGPDGALYLGLGDGGGAGDQFGNGQNQDTLLGGMVRIDVDGGATLWQYGLRNPWRFWIDGDDLWIADVGQRSYEEIDLAPITAEGINYGWPIMEGRHCYRSSECDTAGLTFPIVEVERGDAGACSITGGVVYRGAAIPELRGRFFFSDYCGGFLRSVDQEGSVTDHTEQVGVPGRVVSFGLDGRGEMYVLTTTQILRLVAVR